MKKMTLRGLMLDCNFDIDLARCILALSKAESSQHIQNAFDALRDADQEDGGEVRTLWIKAVNWWDSCEKPAKTAKYKLINRLGEFHGLEYLGQTGTGIEVEFYNAGDIYIATIFLIRGEFFIDSYGDYLQSHPKFRLYKGWDGY